MTQFMASEKRRRMADMRPRRNVSLGKRLALVREALDFGKGKQGLFATNAGLSPNAYNQYEKGKNFPRVEHIMKLCSRYPGITLDWVYLGKFDGMPIKLVNIITEALAAEDSTNEPTQAPVVLPATMTAVVEVGHKRRRA